MTTTCSTVTHACAYILSHKSRNPAGEWASCSALGYSRTNYDTELSVTQRAQAFLPTAAWPAAVENVVGSVSVSVVHLLATATA